MNFSYWRSSITLLAIYRYLRSRLTIVQNNAQKSSIYNWLDLSAASSVRGQSVGIKLIATRLWSLYTYYFSLYACLNLPAFLFSVLSPLCSLPPSDRSPLSIGLLIPSLKSDPRRRHGLLFTNENCKYKAEGKRGRRERAGVSTHDHSRGREQLIIASKLIKSGKHANALCLYFKGTTDRPCGGAAMTKSRIMAEKDKRKIVGKPRGFVYELSIKISVKHVYALLFRFYELIELRY